MNDNTSDGCCQADEHMYHTMPVQSWHVSMIAATQQGHAMYASLYMPHWTTKYLLVSGFTYWHSDFYQPAEHLCVKVQQSSAGQSPVKRRRSASSA